VKFYDKNDKILLEEGFNIKTQKIPDNIAIEPKTNINLL
jgi:hypothetical protein